MLHTAVSSQAAPPRARATRASWSQTCLCGVCKKWLCKKLYSSASKRKTNFTHTRYRNRQTQKKPARVNDTAGQSEHTLTLSSHAYIYRYTVILYQVTTSARRMQHERTHTALTELRAAGEVPATWLHHPAATVGARHMHAGHKAPPRKLSS